MDSIILYIKESYNELMHHVTWPTWAELFSATRLVIVASVIIALVIALMDAVSNTSLETIYNLG
jgi:preprotein translocase subunit SecE